METPPPPQPTTATASATHSSDGKLRLMCSYGGHIVTRPQTKSLYYAGGDTRIITIPTVNATAPTLVSLTTHLATTLNVHYPCTLKYQLPHHDLDSLISISSDEDVHIMLEEHDRLSSSVVPSRIRLFLFPTKPSPTRSESNPSVLPEGQQQKTEEGEWFRGELAQPVLQHPKTEAWFVDALRNAKIMQKAGLEGQTEGNSGDLCVGAGGVLGGQESIALETSSSFGSTSSSVSLSNLPPVKGHGDDNSANLQDNKAKLPSPETVASDNSVTMANTHAQTGVYQEQVIPFAAMETKVSSNPFETEFKLVDPSSGAQMNKAVLVSGYPVSPLPVLDQPALQQMQFIQTGTHYMPQNPTRVMPVTSYYPIYHQPPQQQSQLHFQSTHPYPIYYLPVGQGQSYGLPMQHGLIDTSNIASVQPPVRRNVPFGAIPQVALKEAAAAPHVPDLASRVFQTGQAVKQHVHLPCSETIQQHANLPQTRHHPQTLSIAPGEAANYCKERDDDAALAQIYKSQPPPPALPSQYQTMSNATTVLLSEALAQLQIDNVKQQIRTSQP